MSYIGNSPTSQAFVTDQFNGTGSQTAFTMSVAPAGSTSMIVAVSGVLQDPSTYAVVGTTLNFSVAPPAGTGNISVRYLGIPATGVTTTAYRTATEFTATSGQTTFTPPSYTVGYLDVYRNGVLLGSADYTATNGTTVVLATGCVAGDLVETISFLVSSVLNAIPNTTGSISSSNLPAGLTITTPTLSNATVTGTLTTSSSGITFSDGSTQTAAASPYVLKNRIINGDMRIDQRNAGASVAITTSDNYITDRFYSGVAANSKLTGQQNAGSVTPPTGFVNYLGMTVAASANVTVGASETYFIAQNIEGLNTADLAWGTASASSVTLSFWVRSSVTGTFGGSLRNSAANRSYPFTYTITAANTWEKETITIAGDTSGTWLTTNGIGIRLIFGLGVGSSLSGTAGAWAAANYVSATGAVKLIETNSATFYITGVQLEQNTSATPFERRLYGQELANCQRYYETGYFAGTAPANGAIGYFDGGSLGTTAYASGAMRSLPIQFSVEKRGTPAITLYNTGIGGITANFWAYYNGAWANYNSASGISQPTPKCFSVRSTSTSTTGVAYMIEGNWAASAEL